MFAFISLQQLPLLKQLRLPFCSVIELDDPFIENKRVHMPGANQPLSDSEFAAAIEKMYQALEPHIKAMVTFEYYLEQTKQKRDLIEKQIQRPKTPQQLGLASLDEYKKVACLRVYKNIYQQGLWQSLGADTGVAIKLNDEHPYFRQPSFNDKPQLFQSLLYDDARPPLPSKQSPFPALFRRAEHFAYEQEWRLLRPLSVLDQNKEGQLNSKIPRGLITGIYAGLNCPDEILGSLQTLVTQDLQFRGMDLKQIGVSETHLRLVATGVNL
jgi:hypothetical protein